RKNIKMKKIIFLMFLIMSVTATCQITDTKCFKQAQLDQIYKGLKQGEYLKKRLKDTEAVLSEANAGLKFRAERIQKLEEMNEIRTQMYHTLEFECETSKKIDSLQIRRLNLIIDDFPNQMRKVENKGFWKGAKVGAVVGAAAMVITFIVVN